jgi:AcrR family transcriptional regulator
MMAKRPQERGADAAGSRGRPRDPAVEEAILDATIKLLASSGVEGTSIEKVASEAGTTKVTVYKRFSSKSELIGAALSHLQLGDVPEPTGNTEADLVALLTAMRRQYADAGGMSILGTCLTSEAQTSEFLDIVRTRTLRPRRATFARVLRRAVESGELTDDADIERAISMIIGSFYADYMAGRDMDAGWDVSVIRAVLRSFRCVNGARI